MRFINVGEMPNDAKGDPLPTVAEKMNHNFSLIIKNTKKKMLLKTIVISELSDIRPAFNDINVNFKMIEKILK